MSQKEISELSVMDRMLQENNTGISMWSTEQLTNKDRAICIVVIGEEFRKTKFKINHENTENTTSRMIDRFEQCHCAQIRNLYWMMCQYENDDLKEMLCEMGKEDFEKCFPGVLSSPYNVHIQDDKDEIICSLSDAGFSGFIAEIEYPRMEAFEFGEDGDYKSCTINGSYMQYGYVYADSKEELLSKIEVQSEEMVEYWIEEHQNKIAEMKGL